MRERGWWLWVSITLGCAPLSLDEPPRLVSASPAMGSVGVDRVPILRLEFDRPLAPGSVQRGDVRLSSGPVNVFLSVDADPIGRAIVATPFRGRPLEPLVQYEWIVDGVRDLDGIPIEPVEILFTTGESVSTRPERPRVQPEEIVELFAVHCVDGCHGGDDPALGLDLSSADAIRLTAVGIPAVQTGARESYAPRGLRGMEIVDVLGGAGRPATSYLLYKMLGDPHALGDVMPPEGALPTESLELVSEWIAQGAALE